MYLELAQKIISQIAGVSNIKILENCMTRVRITFHDNSLVNEEELKKIAGVLGLVKHGDQYQIIVGAGTSGRVKEEIQKIMNTSNIAEENTLSSATEVKAAMKAKYEVSFSNVLKNISNIFIPLIPAFIACGLLAGIVNILNNQEISGNFAQVYPNFVAIMNIFGNSIFFVMMILVGVTTAQVSGGSIAIGAALAGILTHPLLAKITLFGEQLSPGRGGIISVIFVVYLASLFEKQVKKVFRGSFDLILTPLTVIAVMGFLALVLIQPIAGFIADGIGAATVNAVNGGGVFTGFILAGVFLPLVMTGLHQALIPIHLQLITDTGVTVLLPILAMAGAGQVGASFAVLLKTKNARLKKITKSALPVGLLGIGEPLIYGVTLPLGKPFITACIGGAFGGAVMALFKVGALAVGISGIPLALSVGNGMILHYLIGLLTAYVAGFALTYVVGFKDPKN